MATKRPTYKTDFSLDDLERAGFGRLPPVTSPSLQPEQPAAPPEAPGMFRSAADTALALGSGIVGGVKSFSDMAGADNSVSQALGAAQQGLQGLKSEYRQAEQRARAQRIKDAEESGTTLDQVGAYLGGFAEAPIDTLAEAAGSMVPTLAAAFIPGAGPAAMAARLGAGGVVGAAQGVGELKGSIYEETKRALLEAGASEQEAEARAVQQQSYANTSGGQLAAAGALGALAGVSPVERAVGRLASGAGKTGMGTAKRIGLSAAGEGATEGVQGAQQKYATNEALYQQGFDLDTSRGVLATGVMEGTVGGVMGGAVGALPERGPLTKAHNRGVEAAGGVPPAPTGPLLLGGPPEPTIVADEVVDGSAPLLTGPRAQQPPMLPAPDGQDVLMVDSAGNVARQPAAARVEALNRQAEIDAAAEAEQRRRDELGLSGLRFNPERPAPAPAPAPAPVAAEPVAAPAPSAPEPAEEVPFTVGQTVKDGDKSWKVTDIGPGYIQLDDDAGSTRSIRVGSQTYKRIVGQAKPAAEPEAPQPQAPGRFATAEEADAYISTQRRMNGGTPRRVLPVQDGDGWSMVDENSPRWQEAQDAKRQREDAKAGILPDDIRGKDGNPFSAKGIAAMRAKREGAGYAPVQLPSGGYVVRKVPAESATAVQPAQPTEASNEEVQGQAQREVSGKAVMPAGLRVTFGGKTYPVESVEDAQRKWVEFRERTGAGVSEVGNGIRVTDGAGRFVARISYNGRAWDAEDDARGGGNMIADAPDFQPQAQAGTPAEGAGTSRPAPAVPNEPTVMGMTEEQRRASIDEETMEDRPDAPEVAQPTKGRRVKVYARTLDGVKEIVANLYEIPGYKGPQLAVKEYKTSRGQGYRVYLPKSGAFIHDSNGVSTLEDTLKMSVLRVENARRTIAERNNQKNQAPAVPATTAAQAESGAPKTAVEWAREMSDLRKVKPSPIEKRFGKNGPTPEQRAAYEQEIRSWSAKYRKASAEQKKALERENADRRAKTEAKPAPAESPTAEPVAESAPAEEPAPAQQAPTKRDEYPLGKTDREDRFFGTRVRVMPELKGDVAWDGTIQSTLNGGRLFTVKRDGSESRPRISGDRLEVLEVKDAENTDASPTKAPASINLLPVAKRWDALVEYTKEDGDDPDKGQRSYRAFTRMVKGRTGADKPMDVWDRWRSGIGSVDLVNRSWPEVLKWMESQLPSANSLMGYERSLPGSIEGATNQGSADYWGKQLAEWERRQPDHNKYMNRLEQQARDVEDMGGSEEAIKAVRQVIGKIQRTNAGNEQRLRQGLAEAERREAEEAAAEASREAAAFKPFDLKELSIKPTPASITGWSRAVYKGKIVWTNGHIVDLDGEPHLKGYETRLNSLRKDVDPESYPVDRLIPDAKIKEAVEAKPFGWYDRPLGPSKGVVYLDRAGALMGIDAVYARYFLSKFKGATFRAFNDDGVQVWHDGRIVGLVAPIRLTNRGDDQVSVKAIKDKIRAAPAPAQQAPAQPESATAPQQAPESAPAQQPAQPQEPVAPQTTDAQRKAAEDHAKDLGGRVVWQQGDLALIEGYSMLGGDAVYAPAKGGSRARVDIKAYTGDLFTAEERASLMAAREAAVKADQDALASNPDGPFSAGPVAFSADIPIPIRNVVRGWVKVLGLDGARIVVTTPSAGSEMAAGLAGRFKRIGKANLSGDNTNGAMQPLGGNDFHIAIRKGTSTLKMLEVLAHELGHIVERSAFASASPDVQKAIRAEHTKWLESNIGGKAADLAKAMRAYRSGQTGGGFKDTDEARDTSYYWKSFGEWFADQVSRWATTQDKPVGVVEQFFKRLADRLRTFFVGEKAKFLPNATVSQWLDTLAKDVPPVEGTAPQPDGTQAQEGGTPAFSRAERSDGGLELKQGFQSIKIGSATIDLIVKGDAGTINMVEVPAEARGQGAAREAMQQVVSAADAQGIALFLSPEPMDRRTSKAKLQGFYRSLGFHSNRGRFKDFRMMGAMVRQPKSSVFSRTTSTTGLPPADVQRTVDAITAKWANAPEVQVIASMDAAPDAVRAEDAKQRKGGAAGEPRGFFYGGKVYINAAAVSSPTDAAVTLFHEAAGHYGLRGAFGDRLKPMLKQLATLRRAEVAAKAREYGLDMGKESDRLIAAEEVLAEMAQNNPQMGWVRKALAQLRGWLRQVMPGLRLSDDEIIANMILPARRFVESGRAAGGGAETMFQRVWHGTPYRGIEKFDTSKIGTGEGAQAYGYGLYFASRKEVAEHYRTQLSKRDVVVVRGKELSDQSGFLAGHLRNIKAAMGRGKSFDEAKRSALEDLSYRKDFPEEASKAAAEIASLSANDWSAERGQLYEVEIPEDSEMLLWDKPLSEQPAKVREALINDDTFGRLKWTMRWDGKDIYEGLADYFAKPEPAPSWTTVSSDSDGRAWSGQQRASEALSALGIKGIKYLDGTSRAAGDGSYNYVIFSGDDAQIRGTMFSRTSARADDGSPLRAQDLREQPSAFNWRNATPQAKTRIRNIVEKTRRGWLSVFTRDMLADMYGDDIPPVREYDRLTREMENQRQGMAQEADDLYQRWSRLGAEVNDKLSTIMLDATVAQVHPDQANPPPKASAEQRATHRRLREMYTALPENAQAMYQEVKNYHADTLNKLKTALEGRIARLIDNGAERAAALADIRERFDQYMSGGPYFPLHRFGDYLVIGNREDGERVVSAYETPAEQQEAARVLEAEGFKVKLTAAHKYNRSQDGSAGKFIGEVLTAIDKMDLRQNTGTSNVDLKAQLLDDLNQLFIKALPDLSYRKHFTHRKNVPGFSADVLRGFASSAFHAASHIARLNYADQMTFTLEDARKQIAMAPEGDFTKESEILGELEKRHEAALNPNTHPISNMLTQGGFIMYLGLSPAAGLINMMQVPMVSLPWLGARYGFRKASAAMSKAYADIFRADWDWRSGFDATKSEKLSAEEKAAMAVLQGEGVIDLTQAHDLASSTSRDLGDQARSKASFAAAKAMRIVGWTFHVPEVMNRQVTALMAFRMEMAKSGDTAAATEAAREAIKRSQFDYSSSNRARIMQGNVARVLTQFKQFSLNMSYFLGRAGYLALKGESPEVRRIARRQLFATFLITGAMAGSLGMPGAGFVAAMVEAFVNGMGDEDDEPFNAEVEYRNLLADAVGTEWGEVISRGLPRLLFPSIDISNRVSLSDLWWRDNSREGDNPREALVADMGNVLGPTMGTVLGWYTAADHMARGDYTKAIESVVPKFIRDPIKAMRETTEGVTSYTGEPLMEVNTAEAVGQFLGFSPARRSEMYEARGAIMGAKTALEQRRSRLLRGVAQARLDGDQDEAADYMRRIAEWNKENPKMRITPINIRQSIINRRRNRENTQDGVTLTGSKEFLRERGRFAEVGA